MTADARGPGEVAAVKAIAVAAAEGEVGQAFETPEDKIGNGGSGASSGGALVVRLFALGGVAEVKHGEANGLARPVGARAVALLARRVVGDRFFAGGADPGDRLCFAERHGDDRGGFRWVCCAKMDRCARRRRDWSGWSAE